MAKQGWEGKNWGVLGTDPCSWGAQSLAFPSETPHGEPMERSGRTATHCGFWWCLKWPQAGMCTTLDLAAMASRWRMAGGPRHLGLCTGLRGRSPQPWHRFAMWPWASHSDNTHASLHESLEVPVWALAHTQFQCLVLLSVLSLWGGGYNKLLPVLRCRGADYTGALGTPVPGTTEDCFPGTSWGEPAKSWRHPAFAIRCLWFNKDSWGILYLFLSWKRLMKAIFLSLAKIFLWQLSSFH